MHRVVIVVALVVAFAAGAALEARRQQYMVYGAGTLSCGSWLEDRRTGNAALWAGKGQWILGWASAAGNYGQKLDDTDTAAIASWTDNYCTANPLAKLSAAARSLVDALRAK